MYGADVASGADVMPEGDNGAKFAATVLLVFQHLAYTR
jgi:hypothetical protein